MPANSVIPIKNFPFIRLVLALVTGIILQWYLGITATTSLILLCSFIILILLFNFLPASKQFVFGWVRGVLILLVIVCIGLFVTWRQNMVNNKLWYGANYSKGDAVVTILEPLVEKANSYKALAEVNSISKNDGWVFTKGKILLYFKNEVRPALTYGSQILIRAPVNEIQNSGNPAALNYKRYCLFQDITGQAFLTAGDYAKLPTENARPLQKFLFAARDWALQIIRQNIHSPRELGIAEALLIGYRNDLDKDLVQAYSNTGVVHIIAISGLHIAVIYAALMLLFSKFKSASIKKWLAPVVILCVIWLFTLVAGAAPSVLRAAVMFSFVLAGKFLDKQGNIYNTLAASAFVLLLINPFYLWDIGFQLSYAAVFGIAVFAKPIENLLYFTNKSLRWVWAIGAVSLAAQVFTTPLIIFQFHQLPLLFFFSNLFIVPFSSLVLLGELALFCLAWWPWAASLVGRLTEMFILWMNMFTEHINKLPFSVWDGLNISAIQVIALFFIIMLLSFWGFSKNTKNLVAALPFAALFLICRDADLLQHKQQQQLVVYNVSKQTAIDIIAGNESIFYGDTVVMEDALLRNFNIKPARVFGRTFSQENAALPVIKNCILQINSFKIMLLGKAFLIQKPSKKIKIDALVLSGSTGQNAADIFNLFNCRYVVADGSVPLWQATKWKKEFEQLHLRFFSVAQNGAFVLNL